jgi:asparagine N-glycosylation enzyme membrane subunit Stt3
MVRITVSVVAIVLAISATAYLLRRSSSELEKLKLDERLMKGVLFALLVVVGGALTAVCIRIKVDTWNANPPIH